MRFGKLQMILMGFKRNRRELIGCERRGKKKKKKKAKKKKKKRRKKRGEKNKRGLVYLQTLRCQQQTINCNNNNKQVYTYY